MSRLCDCVWSKSSSETISKAFSCVPSRNTGGAFPATNASFQREAHKHHRSPGCTPGKRNLGTGVLRSFPTDFVKSRNSAVACTQITCNPRSFSSVEQHPSRFQPVRGFNEQVFRMPPKTFRSVAMMNCMPHFFRVDDLFLRFPPDL